MTSDQLALALAPDLDGVCHGIVSLDPPTIQCDHCGLLDTPHPRIAMAVILSGVTFGAGREHTPGLRLCPPCRRAHIGGAA